MILTIDIGNTTVCLGGVERRVGSLTVGKDADIVVTDGHPFDIMSRVRAVWIGGSLAAGGMER